jgi:hypothetical protein
MVYFKAQICVGITQKFVWKGALRSGRGVIFGAKVFVRDLKVFAEAAKVFPVASKVFFRA